jgi:ATP-dependent Lon protease
LIHITDPVQNDRFNDRYFEEIDLDISRSMIVFTFNDEKLINPILRDRMIVINVKGYNNQEKIVLSRDYIIPEILKQYNLKKGDIIFRDDLLLHIINNIEPVRQCFIIQVFAFITHNIINQESPSVILTLHHLSIKKRIFKQLFIK